MLCKAFCATSSASSWHLSGVEGGGHRGQGHGLRSGRGSSARFRILRLGTPTAVFISSEVVHRFKRSPHPHPFRSGFQTCLFMGFETTGEGLSRSTPGPSQRAPKLLELSPILSQTTGRISKARPLRESGPPTSTRGTNWPRMRESSQGIAKHRKISPASMSSLVFEVKKKALPDSVTKFTKSIP